MLNQTDTIFINSTRSRRSFDDTFNPNKISRNNIDSISPKLNNQKSKWFLDPIDSEEFYKNENQSQSPQQIVRFSPSINVCGICFETFFNPNEWFMFNCDHKICKNCFKSIVIINNGIKYSKCPFCRNHQASDDLGNNYNINVEYLRELLRETLRESSEFSIREDRMSDQEILNYFQSIIENDELENTDQNNQNTSRGRRYNRRNRRNIGSLKKCKAGGALVGGIIILLGLLLFLLSFINSSI